ncbi:DUF1499 domain-containing protein [Methylonatrum kenyense]|uniref:DUF1499 domain-containing protein n=1 Tax=Methylonatrum kenyense TaxID=455253 RepID=UPI0020C13716|nr:DUF1499 domain-containing protein [Methylonatrum kenyense]MCK8515691.1 DUF1499 domain-containing protein [Methylonatrum kenyense]
MRRLLILLILLALIGLGLVAATLAMNQVPLQAEPGTAERLRAYLGNNRVETVQGSRFPEREPILLRLPPDAAYEEVREAIRDLGWDVLAEHAPSRKLHAEVRTPLLGFRDDFRVRVEPAPSGSRIQIHASSRVGQADFGANTRHLLDFKQVLGQRVRD